MSVNGYYLKEKKVEYNPQSLQEHRNNVDKGRARSTDLSNERFEELRQLEELEKEKLRQIEIRQKYTYRDLYNKEDGEAPLRVATDLLEFGELLPEDINPTALVIMLYFSKLKYTGKRVGLEHGLLAKKVKVSSRTTITNTINRIIDCKATCPLCGEIFPLLGIDEKYDINKDNKCDSYHLFFIDYLKHLRLHLRFLGVDDFNEAKLPKRR